MGFSSQLFCSSEPILLCTIETNPVWWSDCLRSINKQMKNLWVMKSRWWGVCRKEDKKLWAPLYVHGSAPVSPWLRVEETTGSSSMEGRGCNISPQLLEVQGGGRRLVPEKQALTHRCLRRLVSFQNKFSEICGCWKTGTPPPKKTRPSRKIWLEREAKKGDYRYS